MQKDEFLSSTGLFGVARSYSGIINLTAGQSYSFGFARDSFILYSNPTGSSGSGIGSHFKIELINN